VLAWPRMARSMRRTTRHSTGVAHNTKDYTAPGEKASESRGSYTGPLCSTVFNISEEIKWETIINKKRQSMHDGERKLMGGGAHLSVPADFMIVSFPEDAAFTICCSTDLLILALSAYITIQSGCTAIRMARQVGIKRMGERGLLNLPCAWMPA
jgi:hypothetical protein